MKNRTRRVIGWIAKDAMNPAQAADAAIAKAKEVCGREACVLHMDTVTGQLTLFADPDMPIPPGTFVRGVAYNSDPDVLAADLRSEALAARLIPGKKAKERKPLPVRRPGPKPGSQHALTPEEQQRRREAVGKLTRAEAPVDDICEAYGCTRSTLYRWRNTIADCEKEAA